MLDELQIRDVGVIAHVDLPLGRGLTVVTGETGAGKTMVVWALELLLGARADAQRVRAGAARALVEARIVPAPPGAAQWQDSDEELVASREVVVTDDGVRSRARLAGRLAPVTALSEVLADHVEIHGQSDTHRLRDTAVQRDLLDRFGGASLQSVREAYTGVHAAWRQAAAELADIETRGMERAREADRLTAELQEIDAVGPSPGEDTAIDAELRRLEHAEGLLDAAGTAAGAIVADGGARDGLGAAVAALRPVADIDARLGELAARAEAAATEVQDLGMELRDYADRLDLDPAHGDELRSRRMALRQLTRKYGADIDAVRAFADQARRRLQQLQGGDVRRAELSAEVARLRRDMVAAASRLSAARTQAGRRLAQAVEDHLADLAMADAAFTVERSDAEPGPAGTDRIRFMLRANPGEPLLPMADAASGGERSRVALALRLALAQADDTQVLVFDEVDAGVGGSVALAVGEKLARLAVGRQVLCVTHQAQLAAYADHHIRVEKKVADGRTRALVRVLDDEERVRELSRLLSGTEDEAIAARHAAQLRASALHRVGSPAGDKAQRRG